MATIVGPNGSGKSTTLLKVLSGDLAFSGRMIPQPSPKGGQLIVTAAILRNGRDPCTNAMRVV